MTFHLTRRATAKPFSHASADPYWRKPASYRIALSALYLDAIRNYQGGAAGPRPERGMLFDLLSKASVDADDLMIAFETKNLFGVDRSPDEGMFVLPNCFPYSARHYANIAEDMRDYAVASLAQPTAESIGAYGTLPALLTKLVQDLMRVAEFERSNAAAEAETNQALGRTNVAGS